MPVPQKNDWKKLREQYGVAQNSVKASVGAKLEKFHKIKKRNTRDAVRALCEVHGALANWRTYLGGKKDKPSQDFYKDVTEMQKDVRTRIDKLDEYLQAQKDAYKLTLDMVLKSKRLRAAFRSFLAKEYATENLDFVVDYLNRTDPNKLFSTYIGDNSSKEINLPEPIVSKLKSAQKAGLKLSDFKDACEHVRILLIQDKLPDFLKDPSVISALDIKIKTGFLDRWLN